MHKIRFALICAISLLLAGCATTPTVALSDAQLAAAWQLRQQQLAHFTDWQINGRAAISQADDAWNAGLYWQQHGPVYNIKLLGPFSSGGIELNGSETGVVLTLDDGQTLSADDAESLLNEVFALQLPINALYDWVRGLTYQGLPVTQQQLDSQGRLSHLTQQDWQVQFLRYTDFQGLTLPDKIFISHPTISVRIVISRWSNA